VDLFRSLFVIVAVDLDLGIPDSAIMWTANTPFAPPGDSASLEEGALLTPKFDANGLISAIVVDHATKDVLMLAHMNAEALARTIDTGNAWYFSRSRNRLWRKGETSGHVQHVIEIQVDCDQDAMLLLVEQTGPACHTQRRSCFYRRVVRGEGASPLLEPL
jgi:phosphoribosyl-AMP cyclohydrolase